MNVFVGSEAILLDDAHLLGVGGEGRVYRWRDRALKVFHDGPAAMLQARARKIDKVRAFPRDVPAGVVRPLELVTDPNGEPIGFTMRAIDGATDAMQLAQRRWREGVMGNAEVASIFRALRALLLALHARGVVVGDLNDGNVLFQAGQPLLIDADSMQFGAHLCVVAHERFLDPRLYGVDLTRAAAFTPETDWYAFAVMLFASLLYMHPYGGQHPTLPTLLRRAEARHSVMRADVRAPRSATPIAAMPEALLDWFCGVFDRDARGPLPEALLAVRWTRCACGLEHARARCPRCSAVQASQVPVAMRGGVRVSRVLRTRGRVLGMTMQSGVRFAYEEDGVLHREDGERVTAIALDPNLPVRVAFEGATTWVGRGDRVMAFHRGREIRALTVARYRGEPAFDANAFGCVFANGDRLDAAASGKHLGPILDGQTWLRLGERLGFGLYRGGLRTFGFLFRPERGGLTTCTVPPLDGRLIDARAYFDDGRVLFCVATEKEGRRTHALHLYDERGARLGSTSGAPEDRPLLATIHGKCLAHGAILSATDDGLLLSRIDAATGHIVDARIFPGTEEVITAASELAPAPGGALYVANEREIFHLSLN